MKLTKEQIAILDHTANRAARGCYCGDSPDMQALVAAGLMRSAGRAGFCPDEYFRMTAAGRDALRSADIYIGVATVTLSGGTYVARCLGVRASCTSSEQQAAEAVARKLVAPTRTARVAMRGCLKYWDVFSVEQPAQEGGAA